MAQRGGRRPAKYREIAGDLRARIERGEWPVGTQMPTIEQLGERYEVAGGTVDKALGVLRDLGVAETIHGMGTFVREPEPPGGPSLEFTKIMQRLDEMEAEIRRQAERIDELEQQRLLGQ